MTVRIGSLCSGAGALDMAVEQVFGAETVWHCEINDAASTVLAQRWPGIPNHRDLTTVDWGAVEPVDILTGGYPCQPFSHAGQRKGTDDERHVWPDVREAIRRVRPRYTVLENVAGHRSLGFDRVLGDLSEDGMHVRWTSLRAADIGACHGRERLFIVVTDPRNGSEPQWARAQGWQARQRASVRGIPRRDRGQSVDLLPTPSAVDGDGGHLTKSEKFGGALLLPGLVRAAANGELLSTPQARDYKGVPGKNFQPLGNLCRDIALLCTPSASDGSDGKTSRSGDRIDEPLLGGQAREMATEWGKYEAAIRRWEALTRPAPAPTQRNSKGNPALAPAFSEWMMGWPAGWVTEVPGISRNDQLRIIGNGVVPQQCAAALSLASFNRGRRMTEHDASDPRCITHILANGITKLDSVCAKCRDEKLGGYR